MIENRLIRVISVAVTIALVFSAFLALSSFAESPGGQPVTLEPAPPVVPETAEGIAIEAADTPVGPLVGLTRDGVRAWAEKIGVPSAKLAVQPAEREPFFEIDRAGGGTITPSDANEVVIHRSDLANALGFDGDGVTVAVIDTGVDFAHPDLFNLTFRVPNPLSPYYLHPVTYDGASLNDYLLFGEPGPNSWWVNTSFSTTVVAFNMARWVNWTNGTANLSWNVTGVAGLAVGEEVRVGFHPDDKLNLLLGIRPGLILFNDTGAGGPFDSVVSDLNGDFNMGDEKRAWINTDWATFDPAAELMFQDFDGDGIQDVSGGMVTFISDGVREIPYASRQIGVLNFTFQSMMNDNTFDIWAGLTPASNLVPGDGNLTILFGDFDGPGILGSHGTWVTSAIAGQGVTGGFGGGPTLLGHAPGAKIIGAGNNFGVEGADPFGQMGSWTAVMFASEGYDGLVDSGDEAQIASNSWGLADWTGWEWGSRFVDYVTSIHTDTEDILYVFAAGNSGPGMGGRQSPAGGASLLVAGAMENYFYRTDPWFGFDGGPNPAFGDTAFFSSRGPSALGRHYLDAITSGQFAYGADPLNNNPFDSQSGTARNGNSSWVLWSGTSVATPNLSGITALIYDAYAEAHLGAFPTASVAKSIVKQSADDAGEDPTLTGAGIANALRGVLIANETDGLTIDVNEWNPGDYRGVDYPAYANILPPGGTDMATVTLTNHRPSAMIVTIADAVLAQTGSLAFNFTRTPGTGPDQFLLNGSGVMTTAGTVLVPDGLGNWSTADSIRISVSFDRGRMIADTPAYLYRIFDWTDVNGDRASAGFTERNLMTQDFVSFTVLHGPNAVMFVHAPAARSHDGLLLYNLPILDPLTPLRMFVQIDYFERVDSPWLSSSAGMVPLPGASSTPVTLSVTVPADAKPGLYEAMYLFTLDNGDVTTLPVMVNVAAGGFPMEFGSSSPGDSGHYQQGQTYGQAWVGDSGSGDYRYHFLDLPGPANVTVLLGWNDPRSVHGLLILTNLTDWFSANHGGRYGPGTQDTVAFTETELVSGNGTAISTSLNPGLSIIVVRSLFVQSMSVGENPSGRAGVFSISPASLVGVGVPVEGTDTFTVTSGLGFPDVQGLVETGSETVYPDLPVDSYPCNGCQDDFAAYLFGAPNKFVTTIATGVSRASYEWFFHSGAFDVDFGLFYDADCDGVYTVADDAIGSVASTELNPEGASVNNPSPGCYVVHAAGFDTDPAGALYDMTLALVEQPFVAFTSLPLTIDPGVPVTVVVDWTLPHFAKTFGGTIFVGSAQFRRAIPIPVSLLPDLPPLLSNLTPADGAVLAGSSPTIGLDWQDAPDAFETAVDQASLILTVDGTDLAGLAVTTATGVDLNLPTAFTDGVHNVFLEVHDVAGSQNRTSWRFSIDTSVPSLVITEPVVSITNDPMVSVAGTTETGALVTVNGTPTTAGILGDFRVDLTLPDGDHSLPVVSTDAAGNSASTTVDITVDTQAPVISLSSPSDGAVVEVASVAVAGLTEPGVSVSVNLISVQPAADGSFQILLALTAGDNTITATATDAAGNSASTSRTVTYTDPVPGLQQDLDNANSDLNTAQGNLATLNTLILILIGLAVAAFALAGVLFFLYWTLRKRP